MQNFRNQSFPSLLERLIAILNYITFGIVGFGWLILVAIRKVRLTPFLQYHIFQSFFLVMLYWLVSVFVSLIAQILSFIPFIRELVLKILFFFNVLIIFNQFSIVTATVCIIIFYLCFTSMQGRFSYIPWVSDIIGRNIRR